MDVALWIVQILLALAFLMAGTTKALRPLDVVAKQMAWVSAVPPRMVRFIGTMETLAAVGLILPSLTRILPVLTPLAAVGLVVVMGSAAVFHFRRGETTAIVINTVLLLLAAFVAYGRFVLVPITG